MSRTSRGGKAPGFEYWTARPGNKHGGHHGARDHAGSNWLKKNTHKRERLEGRADARRGNECLD